MSLTNSEFHLLAFAEGTEAVTDNGAEVDKEISAAFALNETVTLGFVEPLDGTGLTIGHILNLDIKKAFGPRSAGRIYWVSR